MRLVRWASLVVALAAACKPATERTGATPATRTVDLPEMVIDAMPDERADVGLVGTETSLLEQIRAIDAIARDPARNGVFLRVGPLGRGFARADELAAALVRLRAAHEPVHCHFEIADNLAYYVMARGCDRIAMTPAGHLATVGVSAQLYSVRGLLEWAGIRAEFSQAGDAKGASDPFVRDEPSPEHRASVEALLQSLQSRLAEPIDARAGARSFDLAPYDSDDALARHLVDAVEFDDESREHARRAANARRVIPPVRSAPPRTLTDLAARLFSPPTSSDETQPHVVLAYLTGPIVDGESRSASSTAADPFVAAMRGFARDPKVRAVVLRIDSPGGSALASDKMWHAVARLARAKPVIVSLGDMAASGGYYVAVAGTEIIAQPSSVVGSIGVVAGRPDLGPLLERFGIRITSVVGAPSADVFTPFRGLRPDERARFDASIASAYARFLDRVRTGRGLDDRRLREATDGRLWTGSRAVELGLVDSLGGLVDSIRRARAAAHLPDDAAVVTWPPSSSFLDALLGTSDGTAAFAPVSALDPALVRTLTDTTLALEGAPYPRTAVPFALEIR